MTGTTYYKMFFALINSNHHAEDDVYFHVIDVDPEKYVAEIQRDIKREYSLKNFAASEITIWKLQDPLYIGTTKAQQEPCRNKIRSIYLSDPKSDTSLEQNRGVQILSPWVRMNNYWPAFDMLDLSCHVNMIVCAPFGDDGDISRGTKRRRGEQEDKAVKLLDALVEHAPSTLSSNPDLFKNIADGLVLWNRPFEYNTVPVTLLQEEFAMFKDDCLLDPMAENIEFLEDLTRAACEWYSDESPRRDAINTVLSNHMKLNFSPGPLKDTSRSTDGHSHPLVIPTLIRGCKNHHGNPLIQSIAYYANFLVEKLHLAAYTRFPSVLVTDIGSQFGLYACLWSGGKIIVEPLTPVFDLTVHWTDNVARQKIASALGALKKLFHRIETHYQGVLSSARRIQPEFPFPNSFRDNKGVQVPLTFTGRIKDKLVFEAESAEERDMIIKFSCHYSEEAHHILANAGYTPQLRAVNKLNGGWKMVVMEQSPFSSLPRVINYLDDNEKLKVKRKVKKIVQILHAEGFVHGDVRQINILVDKLDGNSVHLIDFDWAGKVGSATYPLNINRTTVRRPSNVVGGGLITVDDDMKMVDLIFYTI